MLSKEIYLNLTVTLWIDLSLLFIVWQRQNHRLHSSDYFQLFTYAVKSYKDIHKEVIFSLKFGGELARSYSMKDSLEGFCEDSGNWSHM